MAKTKGLSKADLQLWAAYAQTVRLLPGRKRLPVEPEPAQIAAPAVAEPLTQTPPAKQKHLGQAGPVEANLPPPGLDRASWHKFRAGGARPARTLDLHGMTASRAHHAVQSFILAAHSEQLRVVEIITGKGEILVRELPHWLNAPALRPLILALAHPHAANTGSLRILLKRSRPAQGRK